MPEMPDRAHRLRRIGITEEDAEALELLWDGSEAFRLIADVRTGFLADKGYLALDALDAIWHELDESVAHLYMQHGFSPHQAMLLDTSRPAQNYLWGPETDTARVDGILATPVPHDVAVIALLISTTPDETDRLLRACAGIGPQRKTPEATIADVRARAASLPQQVSICDCS